MHVHSNRRGWVAHDERRRRARHERRGGGRWTYVVCGATTRYARTRFDAARLGVALVVAVLRRRWWTVALDTGAARRAALQRRCKSTQNHTHTHVNRITNTNNSPPHTRTSNGAHVATNEHARRTTRGARRRRGAAWLWSGARRCCRCESWRHRVTSTVQAQLSHA